MDGEIRLVAESDQIRSLYVGTQIQKLSKLDQFADHFRFI